MTRARGQLSRALLDREYPHQVLVLAESVGGKMLVALRQKGFLYAKTMHGTRCIVLQTANTPNCFKSCLAVKWSLEAEVKTEGTGSNSGIRWGVLTMGKAASQRSGPLHNEFREVISILACYRYPNQ